MSPEPDSNAKLRAVEVSGAASVLLGPLQGYHHETYVFPLPGERELEQPVRWKCREPRPGLLWFDRRCFQSEEQLVDDLRDRITSIPEIIEFEGIRLQRFVEGETLGYFYGSGTEVPEEMVRQISVLFGQLAAVAPETLLVKRVCREEDRPENGDTNGFLERLVRFTEKNVYLENLPEFEELFAALGLDEDSFKKLRKHVAGLKERPFCLLHADLHRENFIVDHDHRLWAIDWELAMLGDPLYDLATHLYLMRYPEPQARRVAQKWHTVVREVRPGASRGWQDDLGLLIDYKKAQSVFTDVIRVALSLDPRPGAGRRQLVRAGGKLRRILAEAAVPLGLEPVPGHEQIVTALERWCRVHGSERKEVSG